MSDYESQHPEVNKTGRRVPPNRKLQAPVPLSPRLLEKSQRNIGEQIMGDKSLSIEVYASLALAFQVITSDNEALFSDVETEVKNATINAKSGEPYRVLMAIDQELEMKMQEFLSVDHISHPVQSALTSGRIFSLILAHNTILSVWKSKIEAGDHSWLVAE